MACQPVRGSDPTLISSGSGQVFEDLAGDVSFQAADHFQAAEPFGAATCHVAAGLVVAAHSGQHDAIQRRVGLAVATSVQSIPYGLTRRGGDGSDSTQIGPRSFGVEPIRVVAGGHQQAGDSLSRQA